MVFDAHVAQIYCALVKETSSLAANSVGRNAVGSGLCEPMISIEAKELKVHKKKQVTGQTSVEVQTFLEVYYFNTKLSFFEPVIEKVHL